MNKYNKTETDSYVQETNQWLPVGWGKKGEVEVEDLEVETTTYTINNLQGYIVQHREPANIQRSIVYKNTEALCYTPETNTML